MMKTLVLVALFAGIVITAEAHLTRKSYAADNNGND